MPPTLAPTALPWEEVTLGDCRLICGDAREVVPTLGSLDAVVTDPPYGLGLGTDNTPRRNRGHGMHLGKRGYWGYEDTYANFVQTILPCLNLTLDKARCGAVFSGPHIHEQRKPTALGGVYLAQAGGRTPWGSKNFLPVLLYGTPPRAGQHRPTVLIASGYVESADFPCAKPLPWMRWLVELASRPGDVICDPFAGSMTTAVACLELGRPCIAIEIDHRAWELGCQRVAEMQKQLTLFPVSRVLRPQQVTLF